MPGTTAFSVIRLTNASLANEACAVVRQSITHCCTLDHHGEAAVLSAWLANKTPDNVAAWMMAPGAMAWGAMRQSDLVGFALLARGALALCYAVPEVLRQGVGRGLLMAAEAGARDAGLDALALESTRTAEPFYRHHGYVPCGPVQHWAGLQALPMRKPL